MLHYDGSAWTMQDLGELIDASGGAMTGVLHGIFAAGPDAVWAVGHSGVGAVIVHHDGERWSNQALGLQTAEVLHAIWGTSPEQLWAVGGGGVILRFDGTAWNAETSPTRAVLTSVHGLSDHDLWAVGAQGTAVHWDGTRFSVVNTGLSGNLLAVRVDIDTEPPSMDAGMSVPPPPPRPDAGADAGPPPAPEGPWSVLGLRRGRPRLPLQRHVVGRAAERQRARAARRGTPRLWRAARGRRARADHALHGRCAPQPVERLAPQSPGDLRRRRDAVGRGRRGHAPRCERMERAASVPSIARSTACGATRPGCGPSAPRARIERLERDGALEVLDVEAAGDRWLRAVWGAGDSLWIVGDGGLALVRAAGSFLAIDTPVRTNLLDVWGDADDLFWAVGEAGTVLRWDGMAWLQVPTGPMGGVTQNLRAVWGSSGDDVWVVGTESTILHWDGQRFAPHSRGEHYSLNDVWGRGPDDIYAVGTGGIALHYDGTDWTELETGTQSSLQSVTGDDAGRVFAAGLDGVVLVREP